MIKLKEDIDFIRLLWEINVTVIVVYVMERLSFNPFGYWMFLMMFLIMMYREMFEEKKEMKKNGKNIKRNA